MLSNTSIWKTQIFKKFEKVKVWKFSHLKKSAITFAQGCTEYEIGTTRHMAIITKIAMTRVNHLHPTKLYNDLPSS